MSNTENDGEGHERNVYQFARLWAVTFTKILAVLLTVVIGIAVLVNILVLPIHVGMWVEMGYGPLEGWDVPVNGLSGIWWIAQFAWILTLISGVIAGIKARGELND